MNLTAILTERFQQALTSLGFADAKIPLSRSTRPEFGDYQFNGAMGLAKAMKQNPRQIAQQIVDAVELDDIADKLEIAGPGFVNIHIAPAFLGQWASKAAVDADLDIAKQAPQKIVIDYSSPNLAKEMHVGHLRSTIIGDATVKVLEYLGHDVIRQNHMGDWGTQFGMLLAHFSDQLAENSVAETALSDLEDFYRAAKVRFDDEEGFADRARDYVVKLQSGDAKCLELWQQFIDVSIQHSEEVYELLNVSLTRKDVMGESAYNDDLAATIEALETAGIAVEDQGAKVVFIPEMADKEGNPAVYIVQKSGGGYLYATTDLAAVRYRNGVLNADRTLIFTDARQSLHFKQTEIVARKAGFMTDEQSYEHCPFGMMLGKDGKPFKTRTGGTVKLNDLLLESIERATALIAERTQNTEVDPELARKIGIGAVKYADLSKNRTTDYVFDWDNMLSFEGNTAPYLQYAYTRCKAIFKKLEGHFSVGEIVIEQAQEKELAIKLMQFEDALLVVAADATPHVLCAYLYDLASSFMRFYEACPILKDSVAADTQVSRLSLAMLTANTIQTGLDLLGIETTERM
ncbi:arginine--tRNA ligase [Alteromonas sp. ASW11-36]|uniref:Arginine--tRNA ligase n=1 Tax=Alteromonas arenosi TaxID=3055817 RepID=A0ABT7SV27_9ALTE|nr:arginine--tRNA ligase [Alteromonas sp. ASW11-36]MDM7860049.1 arginine--tRNA ligase [Alteromonas sp. ASW11-36]